MKKRNTILFSLVTMIVVAFSSTLAGQGTEPWTARDLMEPASLANMLQNAKSQKPVIFNIGPLADIQGAIKIGSTSDKATLDKLDKALAKVPKDKMVVIYCGCCPFRSCPNIRPAFNLLKERGYKNTRLLNLKQNLKVDWTDYHYPMD